MRVVSIDPGTKNLAVCVLDYHNHHNHHNHHDHNHHNHVPAATAASAVPPPRIVSWTTTALDGSGPSGVAATVTRLFEAVPAPASTTEVVIEKQPPKNAKMRTLQNYMEMLWTLRGADRVYVQDARLKLNWAATTPHWPSRDIPDWSYTVRKKLSVEVARAWLSAHSPGEWQDLFESSKKKDDLADALLQALAYAGMARRVLATSVVPAAGGKKTTKAIVARKPSDKAVESGRFTRNGVKWMLIQTLGARDGDAATLEDVLTKRGADITRLRKSVLKNFESYDACARECFGK